MRGDPASERAWRPGACVHGPRERVGTGTRTRCGCAWRRSGRGDPVRACVHGPHERAGVGTRCEQACMGPASERVWGPSASKHAWAWCVHACTGPVRACMHARAQCMRACVRAYPASVCVRACVPCKCVRAWIQQARTWACGDPARATSLSSLIPRASKHSGCKKIAKSGIHLLYEPSAGRG